MVHLSVVDSKLSPAGTAYTKLSANAQWTVNIFQKEITGTSATVSDTIAILNRYIAAMDHGIYVNLNGTILTFDQDPIIENHRTLVPVRFIAEAMDAYVAWNEVSQTVYIYDTEEVQALCDQNIATVEYMP